MTNKSKNSKFDFHKRIEVGSLLFSQELQNICLDQLFNKPLSGKTYTSKTKLRTLLLDIAKALGAKVEF